MTVNNCSTNDTLRGESTDVTTRSTLTKLIRTEYTEVVNDRGIRKILAKIVKSGVKKIPGIGTALTLLEDGYAEVTAMEERQRRARVEKFVIGIYQTLPELADISSEDFLAVLRKVLQDDEDEKTWLYVRLLVQLGRGTLDKETRFHFIHMTHNLTFGQLKFARELYLRKSLELKGYNTRGDAELALTDRPEGMTQRAINTLISWGLIREDRSGELRRAPFYLMNDDMHTLIDLLFDNRSLQPAEIGMEVKDQPDVVILISFRSDGDLYVTELPEKLERHKLKVAIMENNSDHQKTTLAGLYVFLTTGEEDLHFRREECTYIQVRDKPEKDGESLLRVRVKSSIFNGSDISKTSIDILRDAINRVADGVLRLHQAKASK